MGNSVVFNISSFDFTFKPYKIHSCSWIVAKFGSSDSVFLIGVVVLLNVYGPYVNWMMTGSVLCISIVVILVLLKLYLFCL